ncbi:DUF4440 domain-containing protein [Streptomyces somaliensis]|uniref:DUF4440 domain-containing protein n=1 Tax=Streptomyces somaliensis TaxID=78355 RepID=UPI003F755F97
MRAVLGDPRFTVDDTTPVVAQRFRVVDFPDPVAAAVAGELRLLEPAVRTSREEAARLLDPEFTEVGASGRRWTREEMLAELPAMEGGGGGRPPPRGVRHGRGAAGAGRGAPDVRDGPGRPAGAPLLAVAAGGGRHGGRPGGCTTTRGRRSRTGPEPCPRRRGGAGAGAGDQATARAAARPAARPEKRQPPRKVPSRER